MICTRCGAEFDVDEARDEYNSEFDGSISYDEEYDGDVCANCAISEANSYMNVGKAIDMMNGDADYDDDFVKNHL